MGNVRFEDYTLKVIEKINGSVGVALEQSAALLEKEVKRTARKDTGQLRNSWQHKVVESEHTAYIGSPLENAIWEEFGTGEHAANGNGRKTPWVYKDRKGDWHTTTGKRPQRTLENAYNSTKDKIEKLISNTLKGLK